MKKFLLLLPLAACAPVHAQDTVRHPATQVAQADAAAPAARPELPPRRPARTFRPQFKFGLEGVTLEVSSFPDTPNPRARSGGLLRGGAYIQWQPTREWEFRAAVRADGWFERGRGPSLDDWRADLGDTYARYRSGDTRITFGAQTILWGRVDDIAPSDRLSRVDLGRFILDDLADRRLPQLALRWEETLGDHKLDAVLLPTFRGARLPDPRSIWSPVDQQAGALIGVATTPAISALVSNATLHEDHDGSGGAALRLTRVGVPPFDYGLTLARTRQTLPYYEANPVGPTLTAVYPYTNYVGADVEFVTGGLTWRSEVGLTGGVPATRLDGSTLRSRAVDWVGAVEFFPGGGDTRVSLQLAARALQTDEATLQLKEHYSINGEVDVPFDQGRWRFSTQFFGGLNVHDSYLAPKLSFRGWEPHEVYLAAYLFDGEPRTLGGFHRRHDTVTLGLKARF